MSAVMGAILAMLSATMGHGAIDVSVTVDLGRDLGQNLGTLFEAHRADGRVVCGAGFCDAYNTHHRAERYKVQFYVRPSENTTQYTLAALPRVSPDSGVYAYDLGAAVYARGNGKTFGTVRRWDRALADWTAMAPTEDPGRYCATVGNKTLAWTGDRIVYGGKTILGPAETGRYMNVYYAQGYLFCYWRDEEANPPRNCVIAVPWTPYDEPLVADASRGVILEVSFMEEYPYAWGQFHDQVINCSNWGGLYVFTKGAWHVARKPRRDTSYQVYSMLTHDDKLYLAQYPTGRLLVWDGTSVTEQPDWPPVPPGASPSAREAQTTMIYRGELLVGVWPWAELWHFNRDTQTWSLLQRMFTHPQLHEQPVHPYEKEATAAGLVINEFGQRLTSMVPVDDWLLLATSTKGGATYEKGELDFLTPEQRAEYGAVYRLKMPGNLAGVITWPDGPTTLRFIAKEGQMAIYQDGRQIAAANIDPALLNALPGAEVVYGRGVYGPLSGKILSADPRRLPGA